MRNVEIIQRPLLTDKLELSCSTKYLLTKGSKQYQNIIEQNQDKLTYYSSIFAIYLTDKKKYHVDKKKNTNQYNIDVPKEDYITKYPYISHVRLRMDNPYTITFTFNFIRYLRYLIKQQDPASFNDEYDKQIYVHDDNYLNLQNWPNWDTQLIKQANKNIPDLSKQFSKYIIDQYIPDFTEEYKQLTIKAIEINKDYFVGSHNSGDVLHQLHKFIISAQGTEWIQSLKGRALATYKAKNQRKYHKQAYGDLYTPTLKFHVAQGIFFKIYRKTKDHIRFEVSYTKKFIVGKYKTHSYEDVQTKLRKITKEFFKHANFEEIIKQSIQNTYNDRFSLVDDIYTFLDKHKPELSNIIDSVVNRAPIIDMETQNYIRKDKDLSTYFNRIYLGNGRRAFIYDDTRKHRIQKNKPSPKTTQQERNIQICAKRLMQEDPNYTVTISDNHRQITHKKIFKKQDIK